MTQISDHHSHDQEREHNHGEGELSARDQELLAFVQSVREELAGVDPEMLARNTGVQFDSEAQGFELSVFGRDFFVPYPTFIAREAAVEHHEGSVWMQALLAHYFRTADGTPLKGRWISFREMPCAIHYDKAFQGYTGDKLATAFGNDLKRLDDACRRLRGKPISVGDVGYQFDVLPRVPVVVAYWAGDEDFPPTAKLLFDESACHYLPTDAFAAVGARLTNMVLHAAGLLEDRRQDVD